MDTSDYALRIRNIHLHPSSLLFCWVHFSCDISTVNKSQEQFHSRLHSFSRVRRGIQNAALGYGLGSTALRFCIAGLLLLTGLIGNALVNLSFYAVLAIALLVLLLKYLLGHEAFRESLDEAFHVEALAGDLNSRIISALDFVERPEPSPLMEAAIGRAANDLVDDYESRLDRQNRDGNRKRFLVFLIGFLLVGLTPRFGFVKFCENFRSSYFSVGEYFFPTLYQVTPGPGTHIYKLGAEVEVALKFAARGYQMIMLAEQQTGSEEVQYHSLAVDPTGKASRRYRGEVESEYRIHFEFRDRKTDEVHLIFTALPVLENMQTELVYPPYTRLLPRDLEGIQDRFVGLAGTRMTLGFTFSKELQSATLTWEDGEELPLDMVGRFASISLVHTRERRASLQVEDIHGFRLEHPLAIQFDLLTDERPRLFLPRFLKTEMPILPDSLKLFGFGIRVQDDYGVTRCVLKWSKSTINEPANVLEKGEVERLVSPPRPKAVVAFDKIFEHLEVKPGDRISFRFEAYDNKSPKNQRTVSPSRALFIYQAGLEDLQLAGLPGFGSGLVKRARVPKSKRAMSVKEPMGMRTNEKVRNEFEASIDSTTRPTRIRGEHTRTVKNYFRLMSSPRSRER